VNSALPVVLAFLLVPDLSMGQQPASVPSQPAPVPSPTDSAAPDQQSDYNKIVDRFFEMVKAEKYTEAAHVLIDSNPDDAYNVEKHEAVAKPLQKIRETFGPFKDFKPLVSKNLNDAVGYVYGIAIYERNPVRYEFIFFKDGTAWRMFHIDFNVNFVDEIREQAGVHIPTVPTVIQSPTATPIAPPQGTPAPEKPSPTP